MYRYVLFDLDGTLTDPKEGITKCAQYALRDFNIIENDLDKLEPFIGPPLRDSFRDFYGIDGEDTERAVAKFRERFETTGILENEIYPGIYDMLHMLCDRGYTLAIASSKPQEFVHTVLCDFGIEDCFSVIVGSQKDGVRDTKIEVMEEAIRLLKKKTGRRFNVQNAIMVGDRKFDVEAARQMGIASVAVTYGYAPEGELLESSPDYMADSVQELCEIITGEPYYAQYREKRAFAKTFDVLAPLILYWLLQLIVYNGGYILVGRYFPSLFVDKQQLTAGLTALAAIATWPLLAKLYRLSYVGDTSHVVTRRKNRQLKREWIWIVAYAISLALGLNILIAYFRIANLSQSYEQVANAQYSVPLLVGLVIFGIVTPFTEELIFRGIIYNRICKYFSVPIAVFMSALIFGCYHGNIVQMIYAMLMGSALALVYEYYGRHFWAPVLFHCSANIIVYLLSGQNAFSGDGGPVYYGIALLALAMAITCFYVKEYQRKRKRR